FIIAGSAESARRSRMKRRNSAGSESACSIRNGALIALFPPPSLRRGASAAQLAQEFVRRHVIRIFPHNSTDDHLRVGTQNIHYNRSTKFREVVGADNHIIIFGQYVIQQ